MKIKVYAIVIRLNNEIIDIHPIQKIKEPSQRYEGEGVEIFISKEHASWEEIRDYEILRNGKENEGLIIPKNEYENDGGYYEEFSSRFPQINKPIQIGKYTISQETKEIDWN